MKITVIVCTYNYAPLLRDALRTLAAQTFPDFELLIVDDGSTDDTEQVVKQFSSQFRQCLYLRKPHTGLADSRNFGMQAATGTHIAFLDADDLWSPDYLEVMRGVFEGTPEAALVCCHGLRIDGAGTVFGPVPLSPLLPRVCGRLHAKGERFSFVLFVLPSAMIFTKSLYERIGPFDNRYPVAHDQHWVTRAVNGGAFCVRLDRRLILYRQHGANMTSRLDEAINEWLSVYEDLWKAEATDPEVQVHFRKFIRSIFLTLLTRYPSQRNRMLLRRAIKAGCGDWFLEACYWLTYLGLCDLARWARAVKRALRGASGPGMRIDLQAQPEMMFAAIFGQAQKTRAVAAGKSL